MPALPPPPQDEPSPWKALFLLATGVFTLWAASGEWKRYKTRMAQLAALGGTGRTVPGRVVGSEDVSLSGPGGQFGRAGNESLNDALTRTLSRDAVPKFRKVTAHTVQDREKLIRDFIRSGSQDPRVRAAALGVVTRVCGDKWCTPPKDWQAEADALFNAIVDPRSPLAIRYTLDHPELDQYTSVQKTAKLRGGDCDDLVVALGAYLGSIGHRPELVVMQAKGANDWSHILLRDPITGFDGVSDGGPPQYRFLDASMQQGSRWMPAGWEPPGLSAVLAGRGPQGITVRARVSKVFD